MKRFFWMLLIFIFILSLSAFASENIEGKKVEKPAVEKVGKKVSEMPKVQIGEKSVKVKVSDIKRTNTSSEKKVYRKPYVEEKNTVNKKTVKSTDVQAKTVE